MKAKQVRKILAGDHWYRIEESPMPTAEDIKAAVRTHNQNYITEPASQGQRDWDRAVGGQRQLPIVVRGSTTVATPSANTDWTCPVVDVTGCPIAAVPQVEMPLELYRACTELAGEFKTEWIAFLIGELNQVSGRAAITEMYFPPQSASGAHVEMPDETFRPRPGTIGAIHSHVSMGAFWSKTDEDHANWPIEIVINDKGESKLRMRTKLECGRFSRIDGKIILTGAKAADVYRDQLKAALVPETAHPFHGNLAEDYEPYNGNGYIVDKFGKVVIDRRDN